jgi:hypothetical protein
VENKLSPNDQQEEAESQKIEPAPEPIPEQMQQPPIQVIIFDFSEIILK